MQPLTPQPLNPSPYNTVQTPHLPPQHHNIPPRQLTQHPPSTTMATTTALIRYKLIFFVPPSSLAACKTAIFAAGAGRYPGPGNYTEVCFMTLGNGQFRPGDTAKPAIGAVGKLEELQEVRVETLCNGEEVVRRAVGALKSAHPYEEVAYDVVKLEDF
ncbi:hypothetical protein V498_08237 [Pseudogymnoascus sp. VKM F-4517 (FW-2822)]|nr:hypothetical protein V498_08237 [Pseudogymnoascus sp. VKM F-4517 (FW-2822)]